jgi:hypothetical protein
VHLRPNRPLAIGAAALAAVVGGGVAYAATNAADPRDALLNDAAQRLNVSPQELRSALRAAAGDQLDQAVKDGRLTQQQADRIKQRIPRDGDFPPFGGPPPGIGFGFELRHGPGPIAFGLDAAADYLGLSQAQLGRRLRDGDSLADVAKAQGRSVDGLEQALVAAAQERLDKAVARGDLTDEERDEVLQRIESNVDELVRMPPPGPGPCVHGRRGFGPPPRGGDSSTAPGSFTAPVPAGGLA